MRLQKIEYIAEAAVKALFGERGTESGCLGCLESSDRLCTLDIGDAVRTCIPVTFCDQGFVEG